MRHAEQTPHRAIRIRCPAATPNARAGAGGVKLNLHSTPVTVAKPTGTSSGRVIKLRTPGTGRKTPARQFRVHRRVSHPPTECTIETETSPTTPSVAAPDQCALPRRLFATPVTPLVKIRVQGKPERTQPAVGFGRAGPLERRLLAALDADVDTAPRPPFVSRFAELPLHAATVTLRARSCAYIAAACLRILVDDDGYAGLLQHAGPDLAPPNLWRMLQVQHTKAPRHLVNFLLDHAQQHHLLDGARPRVLKQGTPQFRLHDG